jgi:hypothetical protein
MKKTGAYPTHAYRHISTSTYQKKREKEVSSISKKGKLVKCLIIDKQKETFT